MIGIVLVVLMLSLGTIGFLVGAMLRSKLVSVTLPEASTWNRTERWIFWLGTGLLFGLFVEVFKRITSAELILRISTGDVLAIFVSGLIFGAFMAWRWSK